MELRCTNVTHNRSGITRRQPIRSNFGLDVNRVWRDKAHLCDYICLFVHLPASCLRFSAACHCASYPRRHIGTPGRACLTPALVILYRTRQWDELPWHWWHNACHPSTSSLRAAPCGPPSCIFFPTPFSPSRIWWGAVMYKKWLGGNSSNMICVEAHKTWPGVTLKEWNWRAVQIQLPLSHCSHRKCV